MRKKNLLLAFVSVLLLLATFGTQITIPVSASEWHVYSGDSIQAAINLANSGDTIFVHAGTYYEHVVVNKTVSLVGENPANTIIDGNGTGRVVRIEASNVMIINFTIQNGASEFGYSSLFLGNCRGSMISDNIIKNSPYGIELLKSNGSNIIGNTIMNNSWYGIYIHESNDNIIHGNTITNNSIGAWIPTSTVPNTFYHNNFINNTYQAEAPAFTRWDNGTAGNYWSDYTGLDDGSGGRYAGDGIGDTNIPHLGYDNYPLMNPWVYVGDRASPVAEAGPDQTVFQGMTVTFNGSGSYDDVGIKSYVWNFTDVTPKTLTGVSPTYRFKNVGNFSVTLNVTDYFDKWDTDTMWVNVSADTTKPTISFLSQEPTLPGPSENVTVSADATDGQSGVFNVTISYRTNSGPWTNISMSKLTGNTWEGEIPGLPAGTNVTYWIIAYDNAGNFEVDDQLGEYYFYTVIPEFPAAIFLPLFIIFTLVAVILKKKRKEGTFKL